VKPLIPYWTEPTRETGAKTRDDGRSPALGRGSNPNRKPGFFILERRRNEMLSEAEVLSRGV